MGKKPDSVVYVEVGVLSILSIEILKYFPRQHRYYAGTKNEKHQLEHIYTLLSNSRVDWRRYALTVFLNIPAKFTTD